MNSFQSISASIQVARYGYRREYGNIARSFVENVAVIVHLAGNDHALEEFHNGKFQSQKSITYAKKTFNVLGQLYELLSNQFVHIGPECAQLRFTECYNQGDDDIGFINSNLYAVTLLAYIVAELVFMNKWTHQNTGSVLVKTSTKRIQVKKHVDGKLSFLESA